MNKLAKVLSAQIIPELLMACCSDLQGAINSLD